jgi:hypothetical protein
MIGGTARLSAVCCPWWLSHGYNGPDLKEALPFIYARAFYLTVLLFLMKVSFTVCCSALI